MDESDRERDLNRETVRAWEEFRASGLHATSEKVEAWLAGWGTEDELPHPRCHC